MCVCTAFHALCSGFLVLLVSTAVGRASSYMRAYGAKELWPYFRIRCDLQCPYGFETDVEGNYVCLCHDPCQNVICFGRARCVVDLPKLCSRDYCRPRASCKDTSFPLRLHNPHSGLFLADEASTTSSVPSLPARCRLPGMDAVKSSCRKLRVRWSYDDITGSCRSFLGCKMAGNNFRGRRGCEKTCGVKAGSLKNVPNYVATKADDVSLTSSGEQPSVHRSPLCSRPVVPWLMGCKKVSRRWFFDRRTGTCRKFRSCPAGGNNFSRKRHCKNQCLEHRRVRRKERKNYSIATNH